MILKRIICCFKGHDPDPDDDLIAGFTNEPRNWMRRCKRCGRYIMHDGAISGITLTLSESEAKQEAEEFRQEVEELRQKAEELGQEVKEFRQGVERIILYSTHAEATEGEAKTWYKNTL